MLLPPSLRQRQKETEGGEESCCNTTTEGSDVPTSSQQEVTCPAARNRKYIVGMCVAGRYFETRRVSQPVAEEEAEVSPGNHSSKRDLTMTD
jgi:hypothetical protein